MKDAINVEVAILHQIRKNILNIVNLYSVEALNYVPEGFNNNLIWNAAHVVATQQLLVYRLSGVDFVVDKKWIALFKKGTKPEAVVEETEIETLKELLVSTVETMKVDYQNDAFASFENYPTSFGIELDCVETAISFNNVHEGMHFGYMLALRKELIKVGLT